MTRFTGFGVWVVLGNRVIRFCVVATDTGVDRGNKITRYYHLICWVLGGLGFLNPEVIRVCVLAIDAMVDKGRKIRTNRRY